MKLGPLEIKFNFRKTYNQLVAILNREKAASEGIALKTQKNAQLREYRSWVFDCVNLISDRISTIPYYFINKHTGEELTTKNKGYKVFTKPFVHPNDLMSFRFIKSWCQVQLDLCGMACIYKALNPFGQVWELWPLNMNDFMRIEINGLEDTSLTNSIIDPDVKYFFKSGGGWIDFDISELIVINYPHPTNPYNGMSPIQAQAYATDIDNYIEVYERDFFKNSARIDYALATDDPLGPEKAEEIKQRWLSKFQGRFFDVAVLDSGLKPIPLKYTNNDFAFLELANWTKSKVLGAYRVPEDKLGMTTKGSSNRSGSVQTDIFFNREAIQPRLTLWDEELTDGVCSTFDDRLGIKHDNPIPRDRLIEVQESKAFLSGGPSLTINEYRKEYQKLPPVPGGDVILVKNDFVPLDMLEKFVNAAIKTRTASGQEQDRTGDTHVNPDGSDDRDENPTEGRSLLGNELIKIPESMDMTKFFSLVNKSRPLWNEMIFNALKDIDSDHIQEVSELIFIECMTATVDVLLDYWGAKTIVSGISMENWITPIVNKASIEYNKTLKKDPFWDKKEWSEYFKDQFDGNSRLSKIINSLIRSTVNYVKWLIFNAKNEKYEWVVNSNECGHRAKIDNFKPENNSFKMKNTRILFPGEIFTLSCDCTIINNKGE